MLRKRSIIVLGAAAALGACTTPQRQADRALQEADSAIRAHHADAITFAPAAFAAVGKTAGEAKAAYEKQDWQTAIEKANAAVVQAQTLSAAIDSGKTAAQAQWPAVRDSLDTMLSGLSDRFDEALRTRKYPQDMTEADVRAKRTRVDSLSASLERAAAEFDKGDLQGATHAADRIRTEAVRLMMELGLTARSPQGA